ncbi:hypothetical protein KQX54_002906 [Cotesia glomerata]|uniref:Uncharacterized protein n=1 Tax=Cotesia glomerata TaxID=32391 RepID=A0AAV7IJK8_COTGL|nr:hypothetical protein KQX54_002906 [Cotesia glomerata]
MRMQPQGNALNFAVSVIYDLKMSSTSKEPMQEPETRNQEPSLSNELQGLGSRACFSFQRFASQSTEPLSQSADGDGANLCTTLTELCLYPRPYFTGCGLTVCYAFTQHEIFSRDLNNQVQLLTDL